MTSTALDERELTAPRSRGLGLVLAAVGIPVFMVTLILAANLVDGAPPKPVPPSPYLPLIYKYADAMLAHGRKP